MKGFVHIQYIYSALLMIAIGLGVVSVVSAQDANTVFLAVDGGATATVSDGESVTLEWFVSGTSGCVLSEIGPVSGSGSDVVVVGSASQKTYTLQCDDGEDSVTVYVAPTIMVTPSSMDVVRDSTGTVALSVSYQADYADSCGPLVLIRPDGTSASLLTNQQALSGVVAVSPTDVMLNGAYQFRLTCASSDTGTHATYTTPPVTVTGTAVLAPPACPYTSTDDQIVIDFNSEGKLLAHRPWIESISATPPRPITISEGVYDIKLVTYDGSEIRETALAEGRQDEEQVVLSFIDTTTPASPTDGEVIVSNPSADLVDYVPQAVFDDWVHRTADGTGLQISGTAANAIKAFRARHKHVTIYNGPLSGNPAHSVEAICAVLVPVEGEIDICTGSACPEPGTAVDVTPHIPSFGLNPQNEWTPDRFAGTWDDVVLGDRISNLSAIDISAVTASIPYEFSIDIDNRRPAYADVLRSGAYAGSILPQSTSPLQTTELSVVPFGRHRFAITLDAARTIPNENTTNNTYGELITVPVPRPPLSLTVDRPLIQKGDQVTVNWVVNVGYELRCQLYGPGISGTVFTTADGPVLEGAMPSAALESSTTFALQCTEPITLSTFTETVSVEVVPEVAEI